MRLDLTQLKLSFIKKICNNVNKCKITKIEDKTNSQIRFAILKKAAQLENATLKKLKDKNKNLKAPKQF